MFVPATDTHFQQFSLYQKNVYDLAKKHFRNTRTALDIGAHVGYFSIYMAQDFQTVYAFEPIMANARCWCKNLNGASNIALFPCAVGNETKPLHMIQPHKDNSGTWAVSNSGTEIVEQKRIDDFQFRDVDYVKIDVQGYEGEVVLGMIDTLCLWHPIVQIEMSSKLCIQLVGGVMSRHGYAPVEQYKDDVIWEFVGNYNKKYAIDLVVWP